MAFQTQTTQNLFDSILAYIESRIGQTTPDNERSFNRVMSGVWSMLLTTVLKFASNRAKEALTISASIVGLTIIGNGRNILRQEATSANITFEVTATFGTIIPTSVIYKGDANGVRYQPDAEVTADVTNTATITATALTPGTVGNLNVSDTLKADRVVSGASQVGTITVINTTAADQEEVETYRQRLLDDERTEGGGSNSADYRRWAELTPGVARAYPYSGNPTYLETGLGSVYPGQRTVYIKAQTTIDPDGVPTAPLLATATDYIEYNQNTTQSNQALGCDASSELYVEPIYNTTFYVEVQGLTVDAAVESDCKADILTAVKAYFRSVVPFITGLDYIEDKNNEVTDPAIRSVIWDVVKSYGGSFTGILFNVGAGDITIYQPGAGELCKLADTGGITYV